MPRVRVPSSRALAIARDSLEASTPPPPPASRSRKTSQKATSAASRKSNKGKGRQVADQVSDDDCMGVEKDEEEEEEEQEPDSTLCEFEDLSCEAEVFKGRTDCSYCDRLYMFGYRYWRTTHDSMRAL